MRACDVPGCEWPAGVPGTAKGLCSAHYWRQHRHGSLELPFKPPPVRTLECEYPGCPKPQRGRGYCSTHVKRLHVHGDVQVVKRSDWTPEEDARLLALPTRDGAVVPPYLTDLSDRMLDRSYSACVSRLYLLRKREAVRIRRAALAGA